MAVRNVFMRNFPVISMKLNEGTVTRSDVVGPNGGIIEGVVVRSAPVVKGDLVVMDATNTVKGELVAKKAAAAAQGAVHGLLVSSPKGIDQITTSGQQAAIDAFRIADVALFGLGVIEVVVATGETVTPGDSIGPDASVAGTFAVKNAAASTTLADNGGFMALTYAVAGEKVAALVNATFAVAE